MRRRQHSSYRGRSGIKSTLSVVLAVTLVLVALVAAGLIFGQRYIVYTDERVRLELPFFQRDEKVQSDMSVPPQIIQIPGSVSAQPQSA